MKIIAVLLLTGLAILACGCTTQAPVAPPTVTPAVPHPAVPAVPGNTSAKDLVGVWAGTNVIYADMGGFGENVSIRYNITGQNGRSFGGVKEFTNIIDGKTYTKNFTGVRNSRGVLYMSDEGQGYDIGLMTGPRTLEIIHLADGSIDFPRSLAGTFTPVSSGPDMTVPAVGTNISGNWSGNNVLSIRPNKSSGIILENISIGLTVSTQKGAVFTGVKEIYKPRFGKTFLKNFTGAISSDGTVYMADEKSGYSIGKIVAPGIIEIVHLDRLFADNQSMFYGRFNRSGAIVPPSSGVPDIRGKWQTDNASVSVLPVGSYDTLAVTYNITVENGPFFQGVKVYVKPEDNKTYTKHFTGVITPAGDVYISDEDHGYNIGSLQNTDTLEVVHMADGTGLYPKTWVGVMTRQKS